MNNFTAFIFGALLAVILVGYVFFGSDNKTKTQPLPIPEAAQPSESVEPTNVSQTEDTTKATEAQNVDEAAVPVQDETKAEKPSDTPDVDTSSKATEQDVKPEDDKSKEEPISAPEEIKDDNDMKTPAVDSNQ